MSESVTRISELVVGLVGPLGVDLEAVQNRLEWKLRRFGYETVLIRLSELMHDLPGHERLGAVPDSEYERIVSHMDAGTGLRRATGQGDILARLAVARIREIRAERNRRDGIRGSTDELSRTPAAGTAYVLRSLKHPDEIHLLRDVYGNAFFVVSVYAAREERVTFLAELLAESAHDSVVTKYRPKAEELVLRDEREEGEKLGQNVSEAFPMADLFVDARGQDRDRMNGHVDRYLDVLFGHPYITPTPDEFGMHLAQAAAFRSSDLGRQVGAALLTEHGEVIALGTNEVPKAFGGLYWPDQGQDKRDFQLGYDSNARFRREILAEVFDRLRSAGWLEVSRRGQPIEDLIDDLLSEEGGLLADVQAANLLEFGRAVHAEMAALCDAAKRGIPVEGATLYTTTFPCHLCAKHVVAAGVRRVVYIQPYPKSQVERLYQDSCAVDPVHPSRDKVVFEPFVGIAPRKYSELFAAPGKRKERVTGTALSWSEASAIPRIRVFGGSHVAIEDMVLKDLDVLLGGNEAPTAP